MKELHTLDLSNTDTARDLFTEYPKNIVIEAKVYDDYWTWDDFDRFGEVEYVSARGRADFDPVHWTRLDNMDDGSHVYWRPHPDDDNHRETLNIINRVHYGEMQIASVVVRVTTRHDRQATLGESNWVGWCFIPQFGQDEDVIRQIVRDYDMVAEAVANTDGPANAIVKTIEGLLNNRKN